MDKNVKDIISGYSEISFGEYLKSPKDRPMIDLSNANLIECIHAMTSVKNKMSPKYGSHFALLLYNLNKLESDFGCTLYPTHITDIFWSNFIPYMLKRGLALSSIKTCCSQLKTTLEWANRHGAKVSNTYDMVKTPSYAHQQVALTIDEISHIAHFDVSTIKRRSQYLRNMEKVRDMFVLSCNLGQRFSDMVRIDKSCFDRNIFTIMQQKTGVKARVDIERMSMDRNTTYRILDKYGYKAPSMTDISGYNRYLKILLKHIGDEFLEPIKIETRVDGLIDTKYIPKYKLIASHTARRSFITNNVLRGYAPLAIMRASGHKTYSSFEKYLCYFDD